ncbi:hypothetical protein AVEN_56951-1 [Araneus ventricosus]|uniref:Uncharacterized protein n=1 Tax=Araneus ventricosus TaxID=182803 RepID=A0A4Y2SG37_ARAVE|nr:hypothetical protein AVEN_56951-1 [Araneus ventricosus]
MTEIGPRYIRKMGAEKNVTIIEVRGLQKYPRDDPNLGNTCRSIGSRKNRFARPKSNAFIRSRNCQCPNAPKTKPSS